MTETLRDPPAILPLDQNPPNGPCFVLVKKTDHTKFTTTNPFALKRELDQKLGTLLEAKPIRSGSLLIQTQTKPQTQKALRLTQLTGRDVDVEIAVHLNTQQGVIKSDLLTELSNEQLLEELKSQSVVRVQRMPSRNLAQLGPNPSARLSFATDRLPTHIRCGYSRITVNPWVPPPPLCQNCWYDHDTRNRRPRTPICGRCAQQHKTDDCPGGPPCATTVKGPTPYGIRDAP